MYYIAEGFEKTVYFSPKTMEARKIWNNIFIMLNGKICQSKIIYPVKVSLKNDTSFFK